MPENCQICPSCPSITSIQVEKYLNFRQDLSLLDHIPFGCLRVLYAYGDGGSHGDGHWFPSHLYPGLYKLLGRTEQNEGRGRIKKVKQGWEIYIINELHWLLTLHFWGSKGIEIRQNILTMPFRYQTKQATMGTVCR